MSPELAHRRRFLAAPNGSGFWGNAAAAEHAYLRGDNNDKRMWSEFLERVMVDGKDCLQKKTGKDFVRHTAGLERLDRAGRLLVSWGNRSSHSPDVVRPEAEKLIDACEQALDVFKCSDCSKPIWYADTGNSESVQCQCGEMRWRYGRG